MVRVVNASEFVSGSMVIIKEASEIKSLLNVDELYLVADTEGESEQFLMDQGSFDELDRTAKEMFLEYTNKEAKPKKSEVFSKATETPEETYTEEEVIEDIDFVDVEETPVGYDEPKEVIHSGGVDNDGVKKLEEILLRMEREYKEEIRIANEHIEALSNKVEDLSKSKGQTVDFDSKEMVDSILEGLKVENVPEEIQKLKTSTDSYSRLIKCMDSESVKSALQKYIASDVLTSEQKTNIFKNIASRI